MSKPTLKQLQTIYSLAGSSAGLSDVLMKHHGITPDEEFEIIRRFVDDPMEFMDDYRNWPPGKIPRELRAEAENCADLDAECLEDDLDEN